MTKENKSIKKGKVVSSLSGTQGGEEERKSYWEMRTPHKGGAGKETTPVASTDNRATQPEKRDKDPCNKVKIGRCPRKKISVTSIPSSLKGGVSPTGVNGC